MPVVTATDEPEALAVIERTAREKNAPLTKCMNCRLRPREYASLAFAGRTPKTQCRAGAGNGGSFAKANSRERGEQFAPVWPTVNWPGRLQLVHRPDGQKILLDGAHNVGRRESAARGAGETFRRRRNRHSFSACSQDKDWPAHLPKCSRRWRRGFSPCRSPANAPADAGELAKAVRAANPAAEVRGLRIPERGAGKTPAKTSFRRHHRLALSRRRGAGTARAFTGGRRRARLERMDAAGRTRNKLFGKLIIRSRDLYFSDPQAALTLGGLDN